MEKIERRKHPRVEVFDPISYLCIDSKGNLSDQNIAVALNVSQNGIQIESFLEIHSEYVMLRFADLDKRTIEIRGKIIYCTKNESGIFKIGIKLEGTQDENVEFVKKLIKFYYSNKQKFRPGTLETIQL